MKRPWHIWTVFLLCLAVVLAAMGWISLTALQLDRAETAARRHAALEENIRLALWRIDSALAPLVAQESARPYFTYSTFLPAERAYGRMFNPQAQGETLVPSPLLGKTSPYILVHFQFQPDGRLTSPQVPDAAGKKLAVPAHITNQAVDKAHVQLARVESLTDRTRLLAMLPESSNEMVDVVLPPLLPPKERLAQQQKRQVDLQRRGRGAVEFDQRVQAIQNTNVAAQAQAFSTFNELSLMGTDIRGVLMSPLWIDGHLIFARRITAGGREYVQGCLLDWPAVKTWLLATISDLLPGADLEPVAGPADEQARMLAALPVRLVPGPAPVEIDGSLSPIRLSLGIAWGCFLLAAVAVAGLLLGVVRLSERRAAFVSAVTHELRTPLTTFHMYSEMLAEGMVADESQRQTYLATLRAEAARLSHLVENVLSYARLERGRPGGPLEEIGLGQLIEQVESRLADRAAQAGMRLVVDAEDDVRLATVCTNPSAVEQILFNLVDNACKYTASASDKRLRLSVVLADGAVEMAVRDHGPGIPADQRRRLFRSFSKSARQAANSAPGVGLGLALSRRLARDLGGDLKLEDCVDDGACFVLTLRTANRATTGVSR